MTPRRRMRVLVVDADALTRTGILAYLKRKRRYGCVSVASAAEARASCARQAPDVILLDLPLPGSDGLGLLRELGRLAPQARQAVLSSSVDREEIERVMGAGGHAFIHREDAPGALDEALAAVARGERFVSPRAAQRLYSSLAHGAARVRRQGGTGAGAGDEARLSDRELAIFAATGAGHGPTRIARDLGIAVKTVETHHRRIREKLEVRSTEELKQRAERWLAARGSER